VGPLDGCHGCTGAVCVLPHPHGRRRFGEERRGLAQTYGQKHDAANTFALLRAMCAQNGLKFINPSVSDTDATMWASGRCLIPSESEEPGFKCLVQWNPCRGRI
jgi:hypothetical protein